MLCRGGDDAAPVVSTCDIIEGVVKAVLVGRAELRSMQKVLSLPLSASMISRPRVAPLPLSDAHLPAVWVCVVVTRV